MESRPSSRPIRALRAVLLFVLAAGPAAAADWYVDAVSGSDANSGTSAAAPWRTITHGLAVIAGLPAAAQTVHVAPGTYDSVLGETFPLSVPSGTRLVGTAGSAQTILVGNSGSLLLRCISSTTLVGGAEGLTLRQAATGLQVVGTGGTYRDLRVEQMSNTGVSATTTDGVVSAAFERLDIANCGLGVFVQSQGTSFSHGTATADFTDSTIRASVGDGFQYRAYGNASTTIRMWRCRVLDNGGDGVDADTGNEITSAQLFAVACVFAGNQGCGLSGRTVGSAFGKFWLRDSTVADNAVCGARCEGGHVLDVRNSILALNGDDIDAFPTSVSASWSDCANGDLAGFPDCIAVDPAFVAPAARDYRLRFACPCIDVGDPASAGALDLAGHVRPFDGNLDTVAVPDMGAHEFAPLALVGTPHAGSTVDLAISGPPAAPTTVYSSRRPLLAAPTHTPFGALWIPRSSMTFYAQTFAAPFPPNLLPVSLTSDPTWIGRTVSFQARIQSAAAPAGAALSNAVQFTIVP